MNTPAKFLKLLCLLGIFVFHQAYAVPNLISYQGVLNDSGGSPVSATVNMTFKIYDTDSSGNSLWSEVQSVDVSNGIFNVQLGEVQPLSADIFEQDALYLGIGVGADPEMSPRQRITTSGYSYKSETVTTIEVPVGTIMSWAKDIAGVPALGGDWVECNGQVLSDSDSLLDGQTMPNLNGQQRFLRGNSSSGGTGGATSSTTSSSSQSHQSNGCSCSNWNGSPNTHTHTVSTVPPYYDVVWIIKVK